MRSWRPIVGVAAAIFISVVAIRAVSSRQNAVPLYTIKADQFVRRVGAEGTLKAAKSTPLSAPAETDEPLKIAWLADDGTPVKSGDTVVKFDPTDFQNLLREGEIGRGTAINKLTKEQTQASTTRQNLSRDAQQAQRELEAAESFQRKDADVFSRYQIVESEIDQKLARHKKEHATRVQNVRDRSARADRELLEIELRKEEMKLDRARKGLQALEVHAPHDGILVLTRNWRGELPQVGQTVWRGFTIGQIPDLSVMEAEVFVLEADAGGLAVGQKAQLVLESNPGLQHTATVKRVDPVAKPRFRGVPVQYFAVTLELPSTDPTLMKPGTRVRARLILEEQKNVLTVPRQAVFEKKGKRVVYRWNNRHFTPIEVTIGSISLGRVVVIKGLATGDRIALKDPTAPQGRRPREREIRGATVPSR